MRVDSGSGVGLGDAESLQAQLAGGNLRQIALFLFGVAVAQQRAHGIHLRVARRGDAAGVIDLFEDNARLR